MYDITPLTGRSAARVVLTPQPAIKAQGCGDGATGTCGRRAMPHP